MTKRVLIKATHGGFRLGRVETALEVKRDYDWRLPRKSALTEVSTVGGLAYGLSKLQERRP